MRITRLPAGRQGFCRFLIEFIICAIGSESVESEISGLFQKSQKTLDKSNEGVIMGAV